MEEIINQIIENRNYHMLSDKQVEAIETLIARDKELKKVLIDMVNQFAYNEYLDNNNLEMESYELDKLYTGGLSALENAFNVLDIDEGIKRKELWEISKGEE